MTKAERELREAQKAADKIALRQRMNVAAENAAYQERVNLTSGYADAISLLTSTGADVSSVSQQLLTANASRPRAMIGSPGAGGRWQAGQNYFVGQWRVPALDALKAYDTMVSMFGYSRVGQRVDLSGNKYMPRRNFSYIKTNSANINGPLGIYKSAIEAAFDGGIRFWDASFAAAGTIGSFTDSAITTNTPR